jgi:phosphonate transport system permease protein
MNTLTHPKWQTLAESAAPKHGLVWYLSWGALLALLVGSWKGADMRPLDLWRDSGNMAIYASEFFPPNFSDWRIYVSEMVITLQIALWGTALAVVTAVPLALLASANIVPWWVYQPVRRLLDSFRAINEMVFAMLFVVAVGLGPFAGVLALWIHTSGTLAKLFSEAVEAIDPQPVEGIRSTGAGALHEIVYGVIPQVMPLWISYTLYRFEANVRSASVVGMVGAGGIGVVLWEIIRGFQYAETCAVMIIIVLSVMTLKHCWCAKARRSMAARRSVNSTMRCSARTWPKWRVNRQRPSQRPCCTIWVTCSKEKTAAR